VAAGILAVGYTCQLTVLEAYFRRRAGQQPYPGGFVDHYIGTDHARFHVDLETDDVAAEVARLVRLGAEEVSAAGPGSCCAIPPDCSSAWCPPSLPTSPTVPRGVLTYAYRSPSAADE
jgi:hypothetical protein